MKPRIKQQIVYSVLLMRDDSNVIQCRMRAFWLKVCGALLLLLVLAAGLGSYGCHYFWKKYTALRPEYEQQKSALAATAPKLQELALYKAQEASSGRGGALAASVTPSPAPAAQQGAGAAPPPPAASPPTGHPVRISGMVIRPSSNRINLEFNLENMKAAQPISGNVRIALVNAAGAVQAINMPGNALRISKVNQFKSFDVGFNLPEGTTPATIAGVQLSVHSDGNPPYVERFPMP